MVPPSSHQKIRELWKQPQRGEVWCDRMAARKFLSGGVTSLDAVAAAS